MIIGSGFGGLYTAKSLLPPSLSKNSAYNVTVLSPSSRFCFSPLLYELATGERSVDDVAPTLESVLPPGATHSKCSADGVDFKARKVLATGDGGSVEVTYDYLVLCSGLRSPSVPSWPMSLNFFGLNDALAVKRRLPYLETLDAPKVTIIGGGYSGVELSLSLKKRLPKASVTICQRGDEVLKGAKSDFTRKEAEKALARGGVQVKKGAEVINVSADGDVELKTGEVLESDLVLTTTASGSTVGVDYSTVASPDDSGVEVDYALRCIDSVARKAYRNVFALGDLAVTDIGSKNAQTAMVQGGLVALNIENDLKGQKSVIYRGGELGGEWRGGHERGRDEKSHSSETCPFLT